jgi:uncharacterized protein (DUF2249 family)
MNISSTSTEIDVREIAPRERHPLIFSTFHELEAKQSMDVVNDHDPKPLYYQMQAEQPGQFSWDYLENGPEVWRVRITKLTKPHSDGRCCGSCGGGA